MPYRTCPTCHGSGYSSMAGVMPGSQAGAPPCGGCGGTGQVYEAEPASSGHGGSNGCFPAGTRILTPSGSSDIATLARGEFVIAFDVVHGIPSPRRILRVLRHAKNDLWEVGLADGRILRTTGIHSLRTPSGWTTAARLLPGDQVLCAGSRGRLVPREVRSSRRAGDVQDVFNLVVETDFNFVADGVLAHSFTYFRYMRATSWRLRGLFTDRPPQVAPA